MTNPVLPPQVLAELLHHTKALAGVCYIAAHDPDASPDEIRLLDTTLDALQKQGNSFNRRLITQAQLASSPQKHPGSMPLRH